MPMTASTVELGCVRLFRRLGLKRYTKNFKNYPQCWFADLNLSTPDTTARGYTAKRSSIYRRVILKTSWFSLQTDVRTRIVHFLKKLYNSPLLESIELPVLEADFFFFPIWFFQMNFHHFFLIRGPGSPEKSLGTNHRRADFFFICN